MVLCHGMYQLRNCHDGQYDIRYIQCIIEVVFINEDRYGYVVIYIYKQKLYPIVSTLHEYSMYLDNDLDEARFHNLFRNSVRWVNHQYIRCVCVCLVKFTPRHISGLHWFSQGILSYVQLQTLYVVQYTLYTVHSQTNDTLYIIPSARRVNPDIVCCSGLECNQSFFFTPEVLIYLQTRR